MCTTYNFIPFYVSQITIRSFYSLYRLNKSQSRNGILFTDLKRCCNEVNKRTYEQRTNRQRTNENNERTNIVH